MKSQLPEKYWEDLIPKYRASTFRSLFSSNEARGRADFKTLANSNALQACRIRRRVVPSPAARQRRPDLVADRRGRRDGPPHGRRAAPRRRLHRVGDGLRGVRDGRRAQQGRVRRGRQGVARDVEGERRRVWVPRRRRARRAQLLCRPRAQRDCDVLGLLARSQCASSLSLVKSPSSSSRPRP